MIKNQFVKTTMNEVLNSLAKLKENAWQEMFEGDVSKTLFESLPEAIKILESEVEAQPAKPEDVLDKMISDPISVGILKSNNIETLRNYAIALRRELDKTSSDKEFNDLFNMNKDNYADENHEKLREIYKGYCKVKKFSADDTMWLLKNKKSSGLVIGKSILGTEADNRERLISLGGIKVKRS